MRKIESSTAVLTDRADKLTKDIEALRKQLQRKPRERGLQALLAASERRLLWYETRIPGRKRKAPRLTDIALGKVRL